MEKKYYKWVHFLKNGKGKIKENEMKSFWDRFFSFDTNYEWSPFFKDALSQNDLRMGSLILWQMYVVVKWSCSYYIWLWYLLSVSFVLHQPLIKLKEKQLHSGRVWFEMVE